MFEVFTLIHSPVMADWFYVRCYFTLRCITNRPYTRGDRRSDRRRDERRRSPRVYTTGNRSPRRSPVGCSIKHVCIVYSRGDRRRNWSPRQSPRVYTTGDRSLRRSLRQSPRRSPRVCGL